MQQSTTTTMSRIPPPPRTWGGKRTTMVVVLVLLAMVAGVGGSRISDTVVWDRTNDTASASADDDDTLRTATSASIPFPGISWLDRIASTPETIVTIQKTKTSTTSTSSKEEEDPIMITYESIYHAILENDPIQYPCRNFNAWINSWIITPHMASIVANQMNVSQHPHRIEYLHYLLCYIRNFIGAMIVYYGTASIFSYFIYIHPKLSHDIFEGQGRIRPSRDIIWNQIKLSQMSMTIYTMLPVVDEWLVEHEYTKMYYTVDEIGGWFNHCCTMLIYFLSVEFCVYWMHRTLHTNKFLYRHVHLIHHQYKTPETLTPWASIAFHPLDGILQASPYVYLLPILPCHYVMHVCFLFFTAIWATYIHDAMDWNIFTNSTNYPMFAIMGSKYHTIHHTHYIYNHGQFFTFCDWMFGSLRVPTQPTGIPKRNNSKQQKKVE